MRLFVWIGRCLYDIYCRNHPTRDVYVEGGNLEPSNVMDATDTELEIGFVEPMHVIRYRIEDVPIGFTDDEIIRHVWSVVYFGNSLSRPKYDLYRDHRIAWSELRREYKLRTLFNPDRYT